MGRRKQVRPRRSGGIAVERQVPETELNEEDNDGGPKMGKFFNPEEPFYVEIDKSLMASEEHFDISEILLLNVNVNQEFIGYKMTEELYMDPNFFLRFKSINVNAHLGRMKLGHWPALSEKNTCLEFLIRSNVEGVLKNLVMLSGIVDGTEEGVTGLVHLCSLKYFALRPNFPVELSDSLPTTVRIRVEILSNLFDQCESLLDSTRHPWKKSMANVMTWLRPEVVTSETRYGCSSVDGDSFATEQVRFEVSRFYEAIKPSKQAPMLEDELPDMVPELRPYQRRAAYWMVQREKADDEVFNRNETTCAVSPLCVPICLIDTSRRIYYNPFSGNVSLDAKCSSAYVSGGILADEMGLGKTVELLACVLANQMPSSEVPAHLQTEKIPRKSFSRLKRERVECLCGAVAESFKYEGLWVQCDVCDAWQHADCVGYAPERRNRRSVDQDKWEIENSRKRKNRKKEIKLVEMDGEFTCQTCMALMQATEPAIATGATLIVCPTPILSQWHSEILRHTKKGALKICIYEGVRSTSFSDVPAISIDDLLNADIVLTTYDVLKDDLPHDSERHEGDRRFMRFMKRYPVIPTLLTRVLWWRVCLDEAQMVEGSAAAATELALRLHAKNRWCITGTPIQRELDDLYGLLRFLQSSPFDVFRWWSDVISGPYERGDAAAIHFTHNFFKQLMWRSSKSHVWDELELPPQEESISWLSFSPIEQHFYKRQHETCVDDARMVLESFNKEKSSDFAKSDSTVQPFITSAEAAKLFNSLLKLRQACCHPQVGSSGLRSWQKSPMTMEEILSMLIGKTKIEGEDALRKIVVALNGLAGIAMIKKDTSEAVSLYREALNLVEENADDFRLDPLLNIHIHHNLAEALSLMDTVEMEKTQRSSHDQMPCSENYIECLKSSCEDLKQKYLTVYNSKLSVAQQEFRKLYEQVCDGFSRRKIQQTTWWLDALHHIDETEDLSRLLFQKIGEALSGNLNKKSRTSASFGSVTSLKYYIQTGLDALYESRSSLLDRLLELDKTMENPTEADIVLVRYCRNCNSNSDGPPCTHCELDEVFQVYEARLFRLNKNNNGETIISAEEAVNLQKKKSALNQFYWSLSRENKIPNFSSSEDHKDDGKKRDAAEKVMTSKSPSDLEIMLTIIRNVSKSFSGRETISTSRNQLDLLEAMRKEYAVARSLAIAQAQVLRAHDELKMATSRLRLREKNEDENSIDALSPEELEIASVENSSEKFVALDSLCRIRGKLRYLKSLEESNQKKKPEEGGSDSSSVSEFVSKAVVVVLSCPICHEQLGVQKMVFQCGHFTCCRCFVAMTEGKKYERLVMCPVCRQASEFGNIALADDDSSRGIHRDKAEANLTVRGSYSTKIEAVTRRILWIGESDPEAKILVFSSWNDVLDVLQHALSANGVTYTRMKGGRKSCTAISLFRGGGAKVLLLLIQHGANGLNLLEARHVLLMEPLLNPAAEAQAISRVHRIGQRHKTLVHRFMVKNSVEESIYKMNKSRNDTNSFISGNRKNQDQPRLTLTDVESLFRIAAASESDAAPAQRREMPPSVAAAFAAEKRRMDNLSGDSS